MIRIRLQMLNSWYIEGCAGGYMGGEVYDSETFAQVFGCGDLYPGYF